MQKEKDIDGYSREQTNIEEHKRIYKDTEGYRRTQKGIDGFRWMQKDIDGYRNKQTGIEAEIRNPKKMSDKLDVFPD